MSFSVSENLLPLLNKCVVVNKICDFCGCFLPKEFESKKCCQCETIFDECIDCCKQPRPNPLLCHKGHQTDNSEFSEAEKFVIDIALADEPIFVMYGEDAVLRLGFEGLVRSLSNRRIDVTDSFCKEEFPNLAEFLNEGYRITLREGEYQGSILLEVFRTTKELFKK
jgi:hypothetical protein